MKTINNQITKVCNNCYGYDGFSNCCESEMDNNKCSQCGKFCKVVQCMECQGFSHQTFKIGDKLQIFICSSSQDYLKQYFKYSGKSFEVPCKIIRIEDKNHLIVKHKGNEVVLHIDDIELS